MSTTLKHKLLLGFDLKSKWLLESIAKWLFQRLLNSGRVDCAAVLALKETNFNRAIPTCK